jgi:hypothetical protein
VNSSVRTSSFPMMSPSVHCIHVESPRQTVTGFALVHGELRVPRQTVTGFALVHGELRVKTSQPGRLHSA